MDEKYRLVFRGELLDGQHRAVVKRRLAERLKLDDAQVEKLFSGDSVIVKRDADKQTAARYQAAFKQAGGLLRVQPVRSTGTEAPVRPATEAAATPARDPGEEAAEHARLRAIRPGANPDAIAPDFKVQKAYFPAPAEPAPEIQAPAFVVAEVGTRLADPPATPAAQVVEVEFELAEVGADLLDHPRELNVVELGPLDFELAEVGADIGPRPQPATATAPDVSHLALVEG